MVNAGRREHGLWTRARHHLSGADRVGIPLLLLRVHVSRPALCHATHRRESFPSMYITTQNQNTKTFVYARAEYEYDTI